MWAPSTSAVARHSGAEFGTMVDFGLRQRASSPTATASDDALDQRQRRRQHQLHNTQPHRVSDRPGRQRSEVCRSQLVDPSIGLNELGDQQGAPARHSTMATRSRQREGSEKKAHEEKTSWSTADTGKGTRRAGSSVQRLPSAFASTYNDAALQTWSITPRLSVKNTIFGLPAQRS